MEGQVVEAVRVLYSPGSSPDARHEADRFLGVFQNKIEAWNVAVGLLTSGTTSSELALYAAQTIKHKIVSDFVQCDEGTAVSLRDSLWALLFAPSAGLARPVLTQLSLALAALAVQCNEALWPDPIGMASAEMGAHRSRVIQFISHLPEQLMNRLIPLPRAFFDAQKARLVDSRFDPVLQLLTHQLEEGAACRQDVLQALHAWIKYAEASAGVASPALLQVAFRFLHLGLDGGGGDTLEEAVELLCELFYKVHQLEAQESPEWLAILWEGLASIPIQRYAQGGGEEAEPEVLRRLAMVYTEAGEAFLLHLMHAPAQMQRLLSALLLTLERGDLEAVQVTFPFWELLSLRLAEASEETAAAYQPVWSGLLRSCVGRHLVYPPPEAQASADQLEKFRDFRHVVGDVLKDAVKATGSTETLLIIWEMIQSPRPDGDWRQLEAVLFALRTIGSAVDRRESEALPQLFPYILKGLPAHPKIRYAVILCIGVYADWLRYHPEHLPGTLEVVAAGFNDPAATASAAAMALKYLCESCGRLLAGPSYLPAIESLYAQAALAKGSPERRDRLELSRALGSLLAALPPDQLPVHLEACFSPWLHRLAPGSDDAIEAMEHYQALLAAFQETAEDYAMTQGSPLAVHFTSIAWPLIAALDLSILRRPEDWDALVALLRSILVVLGAGLPQAWDASFFALLTRMLQAGRLCAFFPLKCFVLHVGDPARQALAWPHIRSLLQGTTQSLATMDQSLPDLADYFSACTAVISHYGVLEEPALVLGILAVAQGTLGARPPVPQDVSNALQLLAHLLQYLLNEGIQLAASTSDVSSLGSSTGPAQLTETLLTCLQVALESALTVYPPSLLGDLPGLLLRTHRLLPGHPAALLSRLLAALPPDGFVDRERSVWLAQFIQALDRAQAREMKDFLRQLAQIFKRRLN